jgi:Fe-S-cluster containining protein
MTEMELSEDDIGRLERMGYSRKEVSTIGEDGIPRLRNVGRWCYFYDSVKKLCRIYESRPLGCRLYPIVYSIYGWVTVDQLCPMNLTISQDELIAKESDLIELLKKIENEAAYAREKRYD